MARLKFAALGVVAVLAAAAAAFVPWRGETDDRPVLHVGSQKGGAKAIVLSSGVLEGAPYRVEWSEFPAAQHLLEAIAAGAVDLGATGDAPFLFAYASGAKIKAVQASRSSGNGVATAIIAPGGSAIRTVADLRGKRVATGRGSIGHYLLIRLLEKEGIAPSEVKIIFLSPGDAKAAFSSGDIDAWATWHPYVAQAVLHDGAGVIADGRGTLTGIGFQVANEAAIAAKRAELIDFLARLRKASDWAKANRSAYAKVLSQETGLSLDVAEETARVNLGIPTDLDESVIAEERETLAAFQRAGVIATAPDIEGAFDASLSGSKAAALDRR